MVNQWSPRFFALANGAIDSGFSTGSYWRRLLETEWAGEVFPVRNFIQPAGLLAWLTGSDGLLVPAFVTAIKTGNSKNALLTETDLLPTPSTPVNKGLTDVSAEIVAAKPGRKYGAFVNIGANWGFLAFGPNATQPALASKGVALAPNGGSYEMTAAAGNLHELAVNGVCAAGLTTTITAQEA